MIALLPLSVKIWMKIIALWNLAQQVGPKKAREMWFMARFYTAAEAEKMGLVNTVVSVGQYQEEGKKKKRTEFCLVISGVFLFFYFLVGI